MKTSKILAAVATATVAASCVAVSASAYTGYIGFQTAPYSFRNAWDDGTYGKASDYFNKVIIWGGNSEETWPDLAEEHYDWDINGYVFDAEYTDTTISGDGTYTVSAKGIDWALDGADSFNLLFVSTDIPNDGSVTIKDVKIIVDGTVTKTVEAPIVEEGKEYMLVNLCNIWNTDVGGYDGAYPTESLAFEFTVEGLGAAGGDTTAPADPEKGSPDTGVAGVAAVAGAAIVAGGAMMLAKKRK